MKHKAFRNFFCNCNSITIRVQLKDFNPYALSSKYHPTNYIKQTFSLLLFHIKIHLLCWDEFIKNLTSKAKHEIGIKIHGYYLSDLILCSHIYLST